MRVNLQEYETILLCPGISKFPLMVPGPHFRQYCIWFSCLYENRPSWVSPLVWPLTLSRPLRSGVWEHVTFHLVLGPDVWEFPLGGCWHVECWDAHGFREAGCWAVYVCSAGGAVCFCFWLPEKHPAHASAAALVRQWQCCLAFRARGQGGASHHLPTKAQVTQPASALPHFLPSPHSAPHPTAGPAEKTEGFSPFPPLLVSLGSPSNPSAWVQRFYLTPFSLSKNFASFSAKSLSSWFVFLFGQKVDSNCQ